MIELVSYELSDKRVTSMQLVLNSATSVHAAGQHSLMAHVQLVVQTAMLYSWSVDC